MVQAQSSGSTTGGIIGTVKDPQQAALVGAIITARHISTSLLLVEANLSIRQR
ncbi:MAG: hypothetical protein AB1489_28575 [Acidobacteriota bacterium]